MDETAKSLQLQREFVKMENAYEEITKNLNTKQYRMSGIKRYRDENNWI